jgi:arginase
MRTFSDDAFKRSIEDEVGIQPESAAEAFSDLDATRAPALPRPLRPLSSWRARGVPTRLSARTITVVCAARLIQVPFMCGDGEHVASAGPRRVAQAAGLPTVAVDAVRDGGDASLCVNRGLAAAVREVVEDGALPVVVAGSCDASLGVVAAVSDGGCGVVWLDAHGDFNTPESSVSGFFPGMSLAVVVGHCHRERWAQVGGSGPVDEGAAALLGVRDLSPAAERERLEASAIQAVPWRDGRAQGDVIGALDVVAGRVRSVYLHVDLDAFDPAVAPGVVDAPVPGGLSPADGDLVVRAVTERFDVRAATIATYVPSRDRDDRTLDVALRLIELLCG